MTSRDALDQQMRHILVQLALCSHAAAAPLATSSGGSEHPSRDLTGGDQGNTRYATRYGPPFHEPTTEHSGARDDEHRTQIIKAARTELEHLHGHSQASTPRKVGHTLDQPDHAPRPTGETLAQLKKRVLDEGEGWTVKEVAMRMRCGERIVIEARKADGRDPDYGHLPEQAADADERRAKARELRDKGYTPTQIARLLGAGRTTIRHDLGLTGRHAA